MIEEPVSFASDVAPLFSDGDVACMKRFAVNLTDPDYMRDPAGNDAFADYANARHVYARLTGTETPRMPKGGPFWDDAKLQLFDEWMTDGFLA